jgi:hypothetical protein
MTIPVPYLDIAVGITGLVLYVLAVRGGRTGGLATAGLILSIIGTVIAVTHTFFSATGFYDELIRNFMMNPSGI